MNTEQREEIEEAITYIESLEANFPECNTEQALTLAKFARQQLNLRVDGEKLWGLIVENNHWDSIKPSPKQLEGLVLECLTTTPEEKE